MLEFKNKIIDFFKHPKDVFSFFLPIIITLIMLIPLPYTVTLGGGVIKLSDKVSIDVVGDNGYMGALYVRESDAVLLTYLLSKVVPSFESNKKEEIALSDDEDYREKLYFTSSLDAATKVAFEALGKEVKIKASRLLVFYVDKDAKTNLKIGDEIKKVNGVDISNYQDIMKYADYNNDFASITVIRDGQEITTKNYFMDINGQKRLGIVILNEVKYSSDPEVKYNSNGKEAGSSGGLMLSLAIYDELVEEDITKGRKIMGTGSIDINGNVVEIGGIKQKLSAARRADIVFIPEENYKEAKEIYDKKKYKFDLVPVKTFKDAVEYLKKN